MENRGQRSDYQNYKVSPAVTYLNSINNVGGLYTPIIIYASGADASKKTEIGASGCACGEGGNADEKLRMGRKVRREDRSAAWRKVKVQKRGAEGFR